ncbi:MAG: peptide-methionine (S)-S-oxide reductase MsrA [Gemmatimonadota bacterium]
MEKATFGGGCFWCTEAVFEQIEGVESIESGYSGGHVADPTYEQVCGGDTGHAEVVQVTFDPQVITYHDILEIFFATHDPTTRDRQGNDVGAQYRSVIFAHDEEQERVARELIEALDADRVFEAPIVTQVEKLDRFWRAEESHQEYFAQNSGQPYCVFVIAPKVTKLRKQFSHRLKS